MIVKTSGRGAFWASVLTLAMIPGCSGNSEEAPPAGVGTGSPRATEGGADASETRPGSTTPGGGAPSGDASSGPADSAKGSNVGAGDPSTGTHAGPGGDAGTASSGSDGKPLP